MKKSNYRKRLINLYHKKHGKKDTVLNAFELSDLVFEVITGIEPSDDNEVYTKSKFRDIHSFLIWNVVASGESRFTEVWQKQIMDLEA